MDRRNPCGFEIDRAVEMGGVCMIARTWHGRVPTERREPFVTHYEVLHAETRDSAMRPPRSPS